MVVGLAPSGRERLHWIGSGSAILASRRSWPFQVKAEVVYSADWRPCFFLNVGYLARPSKKFLNALSRWRRACCGGTLETSFNQHVSGCCLRVVSAAEVAE